MVFFLSITGEMLQPGPVRVQVQSVTAAQVSKCLVLSTKPHSHTEPSHHTADKDNNTGNQYSHTGS